MRVLQRVFCGIAILCALSVTNGCRKKGVMERTGEKIDNAGKKVADTVKDTVEKLDNDGPLEDAGEAVDKALKDAKKAIKK